MDSFVGLGDAFCAPILGTRNIQSALLYADTAFGCSCLIGLEAALECQWRPHLLVRTLGQSAGNLLVIAPSINPNCADCGGRLGGDSLFYDCLDRRLSGHSPRIL